MFLNNILGVLFVTNLIWTSEADSSEICQPVGSCPFKSGNCQRMIDLMDKPDGDDPSGIDFTKRHRVEACGRKYEFDMEDGLPVNPSGVSTSGRGKYPYWGPNILSQQAILKVEGLHLYFLATVSNTTIYESNLASSTEKGFKSPKMRKYLDLSIESATAVLVKQGMDEEAAKKQILEELDSISEIVLAGNLPRRLDARNAWMEVQNKVIMCHKKSNFCKEGIEKVAATYRRPWIRIRSGATVLDTAQMVKVPSASELPVTMEDVGKYSAFCQLSKDAKVMKKIQKGALTVEQAMKEGMKLSLEATKEITKATVTMVGKSLWTVIEALGKGIGCIFGMY